MGMHILHDPSLIGAVNPCGFCLNTGDRCSINIVKGKGRKGALMVDINSRCPNTAKLSIASASKYVANNPCTNHPLRCPICRDNAEPIWKYNLRSHIERVHPTATLDDYKEEFKLHPDERARLKTLFQKKSRRTRTKKQVIDINISEAHSTRRALR
jgi:hypothetical protein